MHLVVKSLLAVVAVAVIAFAALMFLAAVGVTFIEGDRVTTEGDAEGFQIGMTKEQAFDALQAHYHDRNATVRQVWKRDSPRAGELARFETSQSLQRTSDPYGVFEAKVESLSTMPLPLVIGDRWDVQLPASWVHDVYVTFEADRVVKIQHSRWLFERP